MRIPFIIYIIPVLCLLIFLPACTNKNPTQETDDRPLLPIQETTDPEQEPQTLSSSEDPDHAESIPWRLPPGWPDSIPIMDGLTVSHSGVARGGKLLMTYITGNVDLDETQEFYADLDGWSRDNSRLWVTTGEMRHIFLIDEPETVEFMIMISQNKTTVNIFYRSEPYN